MSVPPKTPPAWQLSWAHEKLSHNGSCKLDIQDPGLLYGHTVFETLHTVRRSPFRLGAHLARLRNGAIALEIPHPGDARIRQAVAAVCSAAPDAELVVRITLTGGGALLVRGSPMIPVVPSWRCVTRSWQPPPWLPGAIKHGSRLAWNRAVVQAGVDEVLWTDPSGHFLEGTRSNIFAVVDGRLCTPPCDGRILPGITRAALLETAIEIGIPTCEDPLPASAPYTELYISSSLRGLLPIREIDGRAIGGSGPLGQRLSLAFSALKYGRE